MKPAFVLYAKFVAGAEEAYRPTQLAKNPPQVEVDPSSDPAWVKTEIKRG